MPKTYKVWIEIEQCDDDKDEYQTLDSPGASVATFTTYDEAWAFAAKLQHDGLAAAADAAAAPPTPRRPRKGSDGPKIHFAARSEADERVHMGPALCGAGRAQRTEGEQYVAGDWDYVSCQRCHRLLQAHNRREALADGEVLR